ncbi:hypothetical protein Tco_0623164 [Tanacetum coccineum]
MSIRELQEQVDALALAVKQYCSNHSCSCCGGPHNGRNYPNFFNQPPQHRMETYSWSLLQSRTLVLTNLHSILRVSHSSLTVVSSVEVHIIVMIAKQGTCPSMIKVLVTIKTLVMANLHFILCISNNSTTVVRENNRILEEVLRTSNTNSLVGVGAPEGSDDYTEVTYDKEQCLSDHYIAHVTSPACTPSLPFLATMEPADTLLMRG